MFTLIIKSQSMKDLKEQLLEAHESLGFTEADEETSAVTRVIKKEANAMIPVYNSSIGPRTLKISEGLPKARWGSEVEIPDEEPEKTVISAATLSQQAEGAPQYDKRGIPWDPRCHASTKVINSDGSWRSKRNVDPAMIVQIESTLHRGQNTATQPVPAIPSASPFPVAPPTPAFPPQAVVPMTQAPPVQVTPVQQHQPMPVHTDFQAPAAHTLNTFKAHIIRIMADLITSKRITQEYVEQLKQYFQVREFWELSKDDVKLSELFESFVSHGLIVRAE